MRSPILLVFFSIALGVASPSHAKFEVKVVPETGVSDGAPTSENCYGEPSEAFSMIATEDGKVLSTLQYCAAYGKTKSSAFTDKAGRHYALLERATLHGSSAHFINVEVYRIVPGEHYEVLDIPIVWNNHSTCHFITYSYAASDSPSGGLQLTLRLQPEDKSYQCDPAEPNKRPPEKMRIIRIDDSE